MQSGFTTSRIEEGGGIEERVLQLEAENKQLRERIRLQGNCLLQVREKAETCVKQFMAQSENKYNLLRQECEQLRKRKDGHCPSRESAFNDSVLALLEEAFPDSVLGFERGKRLQSGLMLLRRLVQQQRRLGEWLQEEGIAGEQQLYQEWGWSKEASQKSKRARQILQSALQQQQQGRDKLKALLSRFKL